MISVVGQRVSDKGGGDLFSHVLCSLYTYDGFSVCREREREREKLSFIHKPNNNVVLDGSLVPGLLAFISSCGYDLCVYCILCP